ncbi:CoA pyrophosphatase [Robiginitalea sp. 2V75]|uniref:CoA pyrophosphatase n=2 Tax=Robiginitalea marina TaxID=2954105 RepID=A0ABT1AW64_9FLAO|nr:CoA pyrophosphatase [Robiginitalea marina]MCO5723837.1 CoA pyrophosphatase [Robiginitalea marina]
MEFEDFSGQVPKIKKLPLPGETSHLQMAPELRIAELREAYNRRENFRRAGVMALFYPGADRQTRLLFIIRNAYPGVHSGQIAFPGGQQEGGDRDLWDTALRETQEEVGVPPGLVRPIRPLSRVFIPPSNFEVSPFMGYCGQTPSFRRQQSEVAGLLEVPLAEILDDARLVTRRLTTSYAHDIEVPAFELQGQIVWGATAMMLNEIKTLLREFF